MNQRCPPIVQVDLAVDRLQIVKRSVQAFAQREPNARFHVESGFSKGGSNAGATGHETGFRSALEIPAARDFCDLPFRRTDLDLDRRPDHQAHGRALAGVAAVEAGSVALILAGVLWALYRAGWALLEAGAAILAAFAALLGVLVQTLPHVFLAGVIALGGVWLVNHLDNSSLRIPTWMQASEQNSPPQNQNSMPQKSPSGTPQGQ